MKKPVPVKIYFQIEGFYETTVEALTGVEAEKKAIEEAKEKGEWSIGTMIRISPPVPKEHRASSHRREGS